ncbi:NACHT domain-containing protein [Micromonospora zamorensis]|uniref:NACHT domain-containing protein n=1 Tax=Micromonospora zamorensis TaxID=709883 RepID=UPI0033E14DB8
MEPDLRVIASTHQQKGDVLTVLVKDLFHILGYDDCRFNVHKTGRELDVIARHRHEPRELIAECKNQADPVGGSDTNKFAGALEAERRRKRGRQIHGYFISLSGFRESAVEQELESEEPPRFVMMTGKQVVKELTSGGMVVSPAEAIASAVSAATGTVHESKFDHQITLIGSAQGWIWNIGLESVADRRSYYCLVQADGRPVLPGLARSLQEEAALVSDALADRPLLNAFLAEPGDTQGLEEHYRRYLLNEFGSITLEGLPADQEPHSRPFRLENLYVPLMLADVRISRPSDEQTDAEEAGQVPGGDAVELSDQRDYLEYLEGEDDEGEDEYDESEDEEVGGIVGELIQSLGAAFKKHRRLAILGLPGSGKTTLLKRLAVAYSDPTRLTASEDGLPNEEFFPVLLRCRTLRQASRQPIISLLASQIEQAEVIGETVNFGRVVQDNLARGRLLLLVDGLDEIVSPSDRAAFVAQLRTFVGMYPSCRIIVTSRLAGFRAVAAAVQAVCHSVQVQDLHPKAIRRLTTQWHVEVIGSSAAVLAEADRLASIIIGTDRIRRLAVNPLLLTTLLLVKRWVGHIPRKRTMLYQKAVEVLLMTWNAEGHEPLDSEETMPQLAFAAYSMLNAGVTTVTADELAGHFTDARRSLPEILGYAQVSVHKLTERVEERSSLLTLSGHKLVDGEIKPTYSFKHLTFQEYFAALAIVNSWLPRDLQDVSFVQILGPKLNTSAWQEVVALTAVLSGKKASEIVRALLKGTYPDSMGKEIEIPTPSQREGERPRSANVLACLADEAPIAPDLAEEAVRFCFQVTENSHSVGLNLSPALYGGRYDSLVRKITLELMDAGSQDTAVCMSTFCRFAVSDMSKECAEREDWDAWITQRLRSDSRLDRLRGAGALMEVCYGWRSYREGVESKSAAQSVAVAVEELGTRGMDVLTSFLHIWALAWGLRQVKLPTVDINSAQLKIVDAWLASTTPTYSRFCAWALTGPDLVGEWDVDSRQKDRIRALADHFIGATGQEASFMRSGALVCLFYITPPESRNDLIPRVLEALDGEGAARIGDGAFIRMILLAFGDEGRRAYEKFEDANGRVRPRRLVRQQVRQRQQSVEPEHSVEEELDA